MDIAKSIPPQADMPLTTDWYGTRPGSSILLVIAGAEVVFTTLTGDENCASMRRAVDNEMSPATAKAAAIPSRCCFI